MTRHRLVTSLFALFVGLSPGTALGKPSFILILADDLGWSSLSTSMDARGGGGLSDFHQTPNIDELAGRGMRFSNAYAAAPVCSPTRYSIQFGKTPARLSRTRSEKPNRVDHDQRSIAQILKSIDPAYRTAHLGKWHIDIDPGRLGYDVHDGMTNNRTGGFVDDASQWHGSQDDDPKRVNSLTRRAIEFIEDSVLRERPFFLQLSHYAVHSNIEYSEASFSHFGDVSKGELHNHRGYAAMLRDLDASIGALIRAYDALGLADDTYILFASDNGGMPVIPMQLNLGRPYERGLNSPLLRGKWDLTEGGIRIPFIVVGPSVRAGGQSDTPVVSYDLMPTIAELAGAGAGAGEALPGDIDGGSFRAILSNPDATVSRPFDGLIFHYPHYNRVGMNEPHSAIRVGNHKLIHFPVSKRSLLFDLSTEAGETRDLSAEAPELRAELEEKLAAYLGSVDAERPEMGGKWASIGREGRVRTKFFLRYDEE